MDPFTHTFVGLAAAKAGLERISPLTTTVCILAANSPDSDVVVGLVGDRWTYLHHHRGITHSIVGVIALAFMVPAIIWLGERGFARLRRTPARTRFRGLLLASLIVTATHPLMDWTNNYGVRPLLPWSGRWFYGDLVFIVDPLILLMAGGAGFLATRYAKWKMVVWAALAIAFVTLSFIIDGRRDPSLSNVTLTRVILAAGIVLLVLVRIFGWIRGRERTFAVAALFLIAIYWVGLSAEHSIADREARSTAKEIAIQRGEAVMRLATMPTLANPTRWLCVAETDRAIYRFPVEVGFPLATKIVNGYESDEANVIERFEKQAGRAAELSVRAAEDRRAKILLNFARFPISRVQDENCVSQTIVQIADLRYTEPGAPRGTFSLNVPVECASK